MQFGTDGVRGVANRKISVEAAVLLGRASARALESDTLLIARDTRISGTMLEAALGAGAASAGTSVINVGVMPTPALALLCAQRECAGAMISASHNEYSDNGIKFFAPGGLKLSDETQNRFEAIANSPDLADDLPVGSAVGVISSETDALASYADHLVAQFAGLDLSGLSFVLDCANGAASSVASGVFESLGATVTTISASPDGININAECGSTYPANLAGRVVEAKADAGFAFDGDADRMLGVDAAGELVDGDHLIAICAKDMAANGTLTSNTVVVTVMTNLGFRIAMDAAGIKVAETQVGDRYLLEELDRSELNLGGEQSGHIIFRDVATTGDGVLSALKIAEVMARTHKPLADLASASMTRLPQILKNVSIGAPMPDVVARIRTEIAAEETALGDTGRVLVRPSGTEPVVRVMVEAADPVAAEAAADRLIDAVAALHP